MAFKTPALISCTSPLKIPGRIVACRQSRHCQEDEVPIWERRDGRRRGERCPALKDIFDDFDRQENHVELRQNIALALATKALFILLALLGFASLWMAVIADDGVTLLVIMNSLRLLRKS